MSTRSAALGALGSVALLPVIAAAQTAGATVRIVTIPTDLYGEAYYARDNGFFAQTGINVEFAVSNAGAPAAAAVAGGSAEIGVGNPISLAQAVLRNLPFTIIATGGLYTSRSPATALAVAKDGPVRTAKDLEGKLVALPALGDLTQVAVSLWLQKNGANPSAVRFVEVFYMEMGAALGQGRVAAAMIPEPGLSLALNRDARLFGSPFDAIAPEFTIGVWFASNDWLKSNRETARKFAAAIYTAGRWANAHRDESAAILAKYVKVDPALLRSMRRATYAESIDPKLLQIPLDAAFAAGILPKKFSASELLATV